MRAKKQKSSVLHISAQINCIRQASWNKQECRKRLDGSEESPKMIKRSIWISLLSLSLLYKLSQ